MSAAVCPYCRAQIGGEDPSLACEGCGTWHHADCYAENGGCTIFGCSKAPADEPKLQVSTPELLAVAAQSATVVAEPVVATPPPPPPPGSPAAMRLEPNPPEFPHSSSLLVPSIFGGLSVAGGEVVAAPPAPPKHRSRTTFIMLGALLGALGAHSFYAGYTKKGVAQLAITLVTLGFAGPMVWVWAVIDICTINQDRDGVQFEA
jgi:TM2 domain-containing membrane protein YozV